VKKVGVLACLISLLLVGFSPQASASSPRWNAPCPKLNLITSSSAIEFKCLKLSGKLTWTALPKSVHASWSKPCPQSLFGFSTQGIAPSGYAMLTCAKVLGGYTWVVLHSSLPKTIPASGANSPIAKNLINPTCSGQGCPQTTSGSNLNAIGGCKISDLTASNGMSEGFPRPEGALLKQNTYNVLVIPVSFSDLPFTLDELSFVQSRFDIANQEFKLFSYSASTVTPTIAQESSWLSISSTIRDFVTANGNDETKLSDTLLQNVHGIPLQGYDAIWLTSARDALYSFGAEQPYISYATSSGKVDHVFTVLGGDGKAVDHGLGHMLFYFDDEYQFPGWVDPWADRGQPLVGFDIYGRGNELIGWNRWLIGWIADQQVLCFPTDGSDAIYRLSYLNSTENGVKMLVIPTGRNSVVVAEYQDNQLMNGTGLLVYKVDLTIPQWQIRFRSDNQISGVGDVSLVDRYRFSVIAADNSGIYVHLQMV
jgi:hypothetical protein